MKVSVIGLGYVGMPLAVAFAEKGINVIGYDINNEKVECYKKGIDITKEIGNERLSSLEKNIVFTSNEKEIIDSNFFIVAVPTPISSDKIPDLEPVKRASEIVGRNIRKDGIVVFESTVYPGVTEDICVPIIENKSGLLCGNDFKVGYSPERINPGDKVNKLENIMKIVSGMDNESLDKIASLYEKIIYAGVYRAPSIKIAEAAKVIENSQRDINIAFMNELSIIFDKMEIDTIEVLKAAGTKWNFIPFQPGLVGGHCIGVDPYYFIYKAEQLGYHSQIILSGRRINDGMPKFIADNIIKLMIKNKLDISNARIDVLGVTFKENCGDTRNSKVIDLIKQIKDYGIKNIHITDPWISHDTIENIEIGNKISSVKKSNVIIFAVAHDEFKSMDISKVDNLYCDKTNKILIDIKSLFDKEEVESRGIKYWRL